MRYISIRFLKRLFYGATEERRQQEWPPSPRRLQSALVATFHSLRHDLSSVNLDDFSNAMKQMEKESPTIHVPQDALANNPVTRMVPTHKLDPNQPTLDDRQQCWEPMVSMNPPFIYYGFNTLDAKHWDTLRPVVERIAYFGTSSSPTECRVTNVVAEQHQEYMEIWGPSEKGEETVSSFFPGRYERLENAYETGRFIPGTPVKYAVTPPKVSHEIYQHVLMFQLKSDVHWHAHQACALSDFLRDELLNVGGKLWKSPPRSIVAHDNLPHVSFFAIPNIIGRFADDRIMGMGIGLPYGLDAEERIQVLEAINHISVLRERTENGQVGELIGELVRLPPVVTQTHLKLRTWAGPSDEWLTVLPIEGNWPRWVIDDVPTDYEQQMEDTAKWLVEYCGKLGLPPVVEVAPTRFLNPWGDAKNVYSRNIHLGRPGYMFWARVKFEKPVRGPLLLGKTRNFGLGMMIPVKYLQRNVSSSRPQRSMARRRAAV